MLLVVAGHLFLYRAEGRSPGTRHHRRRHLLRAVRIFDRRHHPGWAGSERLSLVVLSPPLRAILPIYFAVIAAVFIAWHFAKDAPWIGGLSPIWVYLTFTSNFAIAIFGQGGPLFNPAWTLAVEEQFYLVIPFLILLTPKNRLLAVLGTLCVAAIILRAFWGANIAVDEVLLPWRMIRS